MFYLCFKATPVDDANDISMRLYVARAAFMMPLCMLVGAVSFVLVEAPFMNFRGVIFSQDAAQTSVGKQHAPLLP